MNQKIHQPHEIISLKTWSLENIKFVTLQGTFTLKLPKISISSLRGILPESPALFVIHSVTKASHQYGSILKASIFQILLPTTVLSVKWPLVPRKAWKTITFVNTSKPEFDCSVETCFIVQELSLFNDSNSKTWTIGTLEGRSKTGPFCLFLAFILSQKSKNI